MSNFFYLGILVVSIIGPLAYSFESKLRFHSKWKALFSGTFVMMLIFIPWDAYFTYKGIWWFNPKYTLGVDLLFLPIEEWSFFIVIPFCCVFLYEVLNHVIKRDYFKKSAPVFFGTASLILFVSGIIFISHTYTAVTFLLTSLALFLLTTVKPSWSGRFLQMYVVSWLPFLVVNGALTGAFTSAAPVNYNPGEIIGVRIWTIPVEDSVYSLLMLLTVVFVYERLRKA